jgi:tRNA threonylcarbamoyladenosine biosynthesis protein TsaB
MALELLYSLTPFYLGMDYNRAMRVLAIDTSTPSGGIAALEDKRLLGHVFTGSHEDYSTRFFPELKTLLDQVKLDVMDFDAYAVTAGPGSFTGLRVGLTTVKAWAEVHGKLVAPVSALQAVAVQASGASEFVAAVMDGRRGQIFGGLYRRIEGELEPAGDEVVMAAEEFLTDIYSRLPRVRAERNSIAAISFASPEPKLFSAVLASSVLAGARGEKVSGNLAPWVGQLAFDLARRGELVDALSLDAHYVRRSDAESYWKDTSAK